MPPETTLETDEPEIRPFSARGHHRDLGRAAAQVAERARIDTCIM